MQLSDPFGWVGALIDGKFAIDAVAGEGGFGVVYRGVHLGFELPIAVKCLRIPPGVGEREQTDLMAKFREEARLLHRLSRRTAHIVQALDIGAATAPGGQWTPYIVMEWLEGETLASDLERRRSSSQEPRGIRDAIQLLSPATRARSCSFKAPASSRARSQSSRACFSGLQSMDVSCHNHAPFASSIVGHRPRRTAGPPATCFPRPAPLRAGHVLRRPEE